MSKVAPIQWRHGLAAGDFQAAADATQVASLRAAPSNGTWSEGALNAAGCSFVNKAGKTQFRVYFSLDDDDDNGADYLGWYSGENSTAANRPQLVLTYSTAVASVPVAPLALTATAASATEVSLTWQDAASDETDYLVERSPDGAAWIELASLPANTTTYLDTSLTPDASYTYRVRAANAAGNSTSSNVATATTHPSVPAAPTGFVATAVSENQINLTWIDTTNETGYTLERSPDGATWTELVVLPPIPPRTADAGLTIGTTFPLPRPRP